LLSNCVLDSAIRRVQVNQDGFKLNGTHQLLIYADNFNILCGSLHTIKKNTEYFVVATKRLQLLKSLITW
jgi:hypothetical protein